MNQVLHDINHKRTAAEEFQSMLHDAVLGTKYWAYAVNTTIYLKNCS
jgi:hypothetical protein